MSEAETKNHLRVRVATPDDAGQITTLFREEYPATRGQSSHECRDPAFVRDSLQRDAWYVAFDGARLIACSSATWLAWNRVYELSWAVTHPAYRDRGLGKRLLELCFTHLYAQPRCEVLTGRPLSASMAHLATVCAEVPMVFAGHDGGKYNHNGTRVCLLIAVTVNPRHKPLRIQPPGPELTATRFVQSHILAHLPFINRDGSYPPASIVGAPGGRHVRAGVWNMGFDYEPAGRSLHITELTGPGTETPAVTEGLTACLRIAPEADHVAIYVLADKLDLVGGLASLGFTITAYLPAWFYTNHHRYDCFLVTRYTGCREPLADGFQDKIDLFTQAFEEGPGDQTCMPKLGSARAAKESDGTNDEF